MHDSSATVFDVYEETAEADEECLHVRSTCPSEDSRLVLRLALKMKLPLPWEEPAVPSLLVPSGRQAYASPDRPSSMAWQPYGKRMAWLPARFPADSCPPSVES